MFTCNSVYPRENLIIAKVHLILFSELVEIDMSDLVDWIEIGQGSFGIVHR